MTIIFICYTPPFPTFIDSFVSFYFSLLHVFLDLHCFTGPKRLLACKQAFLLITIGGISFISTWPRLSKWMWHKQFALDVMSIKLDAKKIFHTFGLPLLCMATKNRFDCHKIGDWNRIQSPQLWITTIGDQIVFWSFQQKIWVDQNNFGGLFEFF